MVGGTIGAVLLVAIVVLLIIVMWRKRRTKAKRSNDLRPQLSVAYSAPRNVSRILLETLIILVV